MGHARRMHHRLGYDLPERTGFGGLWSSLDRRPADAPASEAPRHVVATSAGATSAQVRSSIAAFLAATASTEYVAA